MAILVSFFFVAGLRTSVTGVTGLAMHISDGNLRQEKLTIDSTDELGQLALIFNDMLGGLRDNVSQTRAAAESLNAAVVEIVASVREQAAGTSEQAAAVQETTATMEEISQSGNQIAERVAGRSRRRRRPRRPRPSQGLDAAQNGTKVMDAIQEQAETVAENIVTLSEKTQAVGEIIATVTDIAEQSNLLALTPRSRPPPPANRAAPSRSSRTRSRTWPTRRKKPRARCGRFWETFRRASTPRSC